MSEPLFQDALNRALSILAIAEPLKVGSPKKPATRLEGWAPKPRKAMGHGGFCIRTGEEIPFNVEKPFSYEAFLIWIQYGDPDYPERFCHFSGEPSAGDTCFSKPILKKNWNKAKAAGVVS